MTGRPPNSRPLLKSLKLGTLAATLPAAYCRPVGSSWTTPHSTESSSATRSIAAPTAAPNSGCTNCRLLDPSTGTNTSSWASSFAQALGTPPSGAGPPSARRPQAVDNSTEPAHPRWVSIPPSSADLYELILGVQSPATGPWREWLGLFDPILGNSALDRLANASYQIVIESASY